MIEQYERYWEIRIQGQSAGELPANALDGVAVGAALEGQYAVIAQNQQSGLRRVGEPTLTDFSADVDGDTATAFVCVDDSEWGAEVNGEPVEQPPGGLSAHAATLERQGDTWLVTAAVDDETILAEKKC
ncbi:hypothetical protein D9V41_03660 [Aeromicrobium phragmitis]|uniref:Nuclear transport factor 2 family protein n=1 Tax=Aeromicrobium phragmitis TaxID=2478914 RepID=A0A3L8PPX8_9ACTN|nr:hypothetical protein D9V41_03660 [Aeromicrobium phragmitis]